MKKRIYVFESDPIYRAYFAVHVGGTRAQALQWFGKKINLPPTSEDIREAEQGQSNGTIFTVRGLLSFAIWLREVPEKPTANILGTIAHEALHATWHVLHTVGIENITEDSEEAFCYYHAYLVREIAARLWPETREP